ncbi:MAG: hypothetical protein DMC59_02120 [Verrucomicrobia bacterium]|nr:MAG: hypothetical protein DMC59_02120 [Verrucomicrobiota bacterium]
MLVHLEHIAGVIVKHGQLLVASRNETENVMKDKLVTLSRRFVCAECGMTTLEMTLICLDFELLCYLAFKVAQAIGA